MDLTVGNFILAFLAGLASVASPCVLPVLPIIVTGGKEDSKWRPVAIVTGLALSFMLMGVVTSLFGSFIADKFAYLEKAAGVIILIFGVLMLFDINLFKRLTFFNRFHRQGKNSGLVGGLILGATLGLIWVPCVGPMLSSVLALVATRGELTLGLVMLGIYSLGFAVPMLLLAYFSHFFRGKLRSLSAAPMALRLFSGGVLVIFGVYILWNGLLIV